MATFMPTTSVLNAEEVLKEARKQVRDAVYLALQTIKTETGLSPSSVRINVEMISTGPTLSHPRGEHLLGEVTTEFKV